MFGRISALAATLVTCCLAGQAAASDATPRLVLQITVDGLRGDLLNRYGDRFGSGGFRYLLENGVVYTDAHYAHANTETIMGHTTLATGAHPSRHGMVGNVWYDRESGELAYNIEDPHHALLPTRDKVAAGVQVDPAQKHSRTSGRSPVSILASTLSDELWIHTGGRSRVFAVSGKDRSAVAMAGHVGKAFWYSADSGDFQTSDYYYETYPRWVSDWNARQQAKGLSGASWSLLNDQSTYLLGPFDDRPFETDLKGYGRVFPHPFGSPDDPTFFTKVLISPEIDRLTADFSKALVRAEGLGADSLPDYLSVSFAGVDAVGHFFGPSSLENEDVVLQLDRILADFLGFIDETVGLDHTLIVLSADHGMPEAPEVLAARGMNVGRMDPKELVEMAKLVGREAFGLEGTFVRAFYRPYLYLDPDVIAKAGLEQEAVERAIADAVQQHEGIAIAASMKALPSLQNTPTMERIRNNHHPVRSGDVYVVQEPYWYLQEGGAIAVMHGSPWRYDTHVPIIFAGAGLRGDSVHRRVRPVDVAPTLAAFLGIKPPSSASGEILTEVLE